MLDQKIVLAKMQSVDALRRNSAIGPRNVGEIEVIENDSISNKIPKLCVFEIGKQHEIA